MLEYFLVFVLLASIAFAVPLPEETSLLIAAYLAATGSNTALLVLVAVLGISFSDAVNYARGRFSSRVFKEFKQGKQFINKTGFFAIFTSRFFISSRVVLPFMAGAMQMGRWKFHGASILSALLSSVLYIGLGAALYRSLTFAGYAVVVWLVLLTLMTSVLVNIATRSQVNYLLKKD